MCSTSYRLHSIVCFPLSRNTRPVDWWKEGQQKTRRKIDCPLPKSIKIQHQTYLRSGLRCHTHTRQGIHPFPAYTKNWHQLLLLHRELCLSIWLSYQERKSSRNYSTERESNSTSNSFQTLNGKSQTWALLLPPHRPNIHPTWLPFHLINLFISSLAFDMRRSVETSSKPSPQKRLAKGKEKVALNFSLHSGGRDLKSAREFFDREKEEESRERHKERWNRNSIKMPTRKNW